MFHRAPVIDHLQGSTLTLDGDALQAAAEHPDAVAQERTVGRIVHVAFDAGRVGAKLLPWSYALLAGQADHALMNLRGDGRSEQSKAAAEDREIGGRVGIEVGEAAVHQVAAQLSFQIAEAPAFQVLHDTAAQQTIGGHAAAPSASGTGATLGQTLADQVDQSGIVQEVIDGVEQIVLEQGGLLGQGGVKEPGLVRRGGDHYVLEYIE